MSTRRTFLALLFGLPAVPALPLSREPVRSYVLTDCFVAGFRYHDGPSLIRRMQPGTRLALIPEPDNSHDLNAVRLEFDGRRIGYLPRDKNHTVAGLLRQGARVECVVTTVSESAPAWEALRIQTSISA